MPPKKHTINIHKKHYMLFSLNPSFKQTSFQIDSFHGMEKKVHMNNHAGNMNKLNN